MYTSDPGSLEEDFPKGWAVSEWLCSQVTFFLVFSDNL